MPFKLANILACLWLVVTGCLLVIQPFLAEPVKTYAGHAMYLTFFGGIGAAVVAFKVRTGSFPVLKPSESPAMSMRANISAALIWIAAFLIVGVGTASALKYFGWVGNRRVLFVVCLSAPIVVASGYFVCRYLRHASIEQK